VTLLVTDRLRGLPLVEADFDDLVGLHRDRRIVTPEMTAAETREWLEWRLAHWRDHGFGVWMFRDAAGEFVGRCGIHRWRLDGKPEVEIGYVVRSELWSQGYATEMGRAVVDHAFGALGLETLVAFTRPRNLASRRVMEKLGFLFERAFAVDGKGSVLYRLASSSPRP
jgi:[ribosomal protein S5]-alanine N-acetyltransferase